MIRENPERKWAYYTFILGITWLTYANSLNMFSTAIIGSNNIDTILSLVIIGVPLLFFLRSKHYKIKADVIIVFAVMMGLFYLDKLHPYAISSNSKNLINTFLSQGFGGYVFARVLNNEDEIDDSLIYIAIITYISCVFMPFLPSEVAVLYGGSSAENYGAYMLFGYRMLPGILIFLHLYLKKNHFVYLILFLAGFIETVLFANRGAVLGVIVYYILYTILFLEARQRIKKIIFSLAFIALFWYFTSSSGLLILTGFLERINIASRNINKLLSNSIQESGRESIYLTIQQKIAENWLFGVGFSGAWFNGKPHNIFYELALEFGIIGAAILIVVFIVKVKKISRDKQAAKIMLIFMISGIVPSMFSGSYIISWMFWVMLGILVTLNISRKKEGKSK